MKQSLVRSLLLLLFGVVSCCVIYPLALLLVGQTLFRPQANGSMVTGPDGKPVGSSLIAQSFTGDDRDGSHVSGDGSFFLCRDEVTVLFIHITDGYLVDGAQRCSNVYNISRV